MFDKLLNIYDDNSESVISLAKTLLIFYVIIAGQFTGGLIGKQMREYIQENRTAQHIIGFLMLLVLINLVGGIKDMKKSIIYSVIGYSWFILTTKLDIQWNLIIILLLFVSYLYERNMFEKEDKIKQNNILTAEERDKIIGTNKNYRSIIVVSILIVTLVGTLLYEQKKGVQYGGEFSIKKYLLF